MDVITVLAFQMKTEGIFLQLQQWDIDRAVDLPSIEAFQRKTEWIFLQLQQLVRQGSGCSLNRSIFQRKAE
jgi:hypothetical protein